MFNTRGGTTVPMARPIVRSAKNQSCAISNGCMLLYSIRWMCSHQMATSHQQLGHVLCRSVLSCCCVYYRAKSISRFSAHVQQRPLNTLPVAYVRSGSRELCDVYTTTTTSKTHCCCSHCTVLLELHR